MNTQSHKKSHQCPRRKTLCKLRMKTPTPNTQSPTPLAALTYEPLGIVPATMHRQRERRLANGKRVECPTCGSMKAPGAVVTERGPEWSIQYECMVGLRSTYCDGCAHVIRWLEVFAFGRPTGEVLSGPGFSSGDTYIRSYLSAHPQAQEVEQC